MAKDRLSVPELYRLVVSAPVSFEQVGSESWRKGSFCFQCLEEADARRKTGRQRADLELVSDYFLLEWANLSDRTRSVVLSTFTSMVDILNRGVIRDLMSGPVTNVTPEMAQDGGLILVDLPLKVFGEIRACLRSGALEILFPACPQERRNPGRESTANIYRRRRKPSAGGVPGPGLPDNRSQQPHGRRQCHAVDLELPVGARRREGGIGSP